MPRSKKRASAPLPLVFTLLDTPAFGGAEQYLLDHLLFLAQKGYPVVVATNNQHVRQMYTKAITSHKCRNFQVITAPYLLDAIGNWKGLLKFWLALPAALWWCVVTLRQLTRQQRVVCYWAGFTDRLVFSPLAKIFGCRLIWIEIGPLAPTFAKNWEFPRWLYFLVKNLPDHFTTTSAWTRQSMVKEASINPAQISLLYPSVQQWPPSELAKLQTQGQHWRRQHQLLHKQVVVSLGRLATENETHLAVRALAEVFQKQPAWQKRVHLVIIGDGPTRDELEALVKKLELSTNVTFLGFAPPQLKHAILSTADCFVFTRAWDLDGFGMTTIEAMAAGTAVITSDFGPQKEIVRNQENGLLFKPHNVKSLAEKMHIIISNTELRTKLARRGHHFVRDNFSDTQSQLLLLGIIGQ